MKTKSTAKAGSAAALTVVAAATLLAPASADAWTQFCARSFTSSSATPDICDAGISANIQAVRGSASTHNDGSACVKVTDSTYHTTVKWGTDAQTGSGSYSSCTWGNQAWAQMSYSSGCCWDPRIEERYVPGAYKAEYTTF